MLEVNIGYFSFKLKAIIITAFILASCFFNIKALSANQSKNGFVILNLHWDEGEISLNDLKRVDGLYRKRKRILQNKNFFFKVISEDGRNILSDYFEIPINLKYDCFDQVKGIFKGGSIDRSKVDFVIRLPLYDEAREIRFFRGDPKCQIDRKRYEMEDGASFLGAIFIDTF